MSRPTPPVASHGVAYSVMVSEEWYDYLNADRDWALAELAKRDEELEKYRRWAGSCDPSPEVQAQLQRYQDDLKIIYELISTAHAALTEPKETP